MLRATAKKRKAVTRMINRMMSRRTTTKRHAARLAGVMNAMSKCTTAPTLLLLRRLYQQIGKVRAWDDTIYLSDDTIRDLLTWRNNLLTWTGTELLEPTFAATIYTDSSGSAWGAWTTATPEELHGVWNETEMKYSINWKELETVYRALQHYGPLLHDSAVLIRTDNATAVAHLNGRPGRLKHLIDIDRRINDACQRHNLNAHVSWIATKENMRADELSRLPSKHEWQISSRAFAQLDHRWGPLTVDRFASPANNKLARFNARWHAATAEAVDAFTQDWSRDNNYLAPPLRLIPRVLRYLRKCRAQAVLLTPRWPSQTWWPMLLSMTTAPPILIPHSEVSNPSTTTAPEPIRFPSWQLMAWRVSGETPLPDATGKPTTPQP